MHAEYTCTVQMDYRKEFTKVVVHSGMHGVGLELECKPVLCGPGLLEFFKRLCTLGWRLAVQGMGGEDCPEVVAPGARQLFKNQSGSQ